MAVQAHDAFMNEKTPLFLSNPAPKLVLAGIPEITLSNLSGVLYCNGFPFYNEALSNWSLYPTKSNKILFDASNKLQIIAGDLYFNNEILALASNISNVADWYLFPALSNIFLDTAVGIEFGNASNLLALGMSFLEYSGVSLDVRTWACNSALSNVDMSNHNIINATNIETAQLTGNAGGSSNLTVNADYLYLNGNNGIFMSNLETNPLQASSINIKASGGTGGTVYVTGDTGLVAGGGRVSIVANAGDFDGTGYGGLVDITAFSASNAGLTSAIKFSAAGINSYAGAIPSIGSLAGYNFIYGTAGVNICAGLPSIFPNIPTTTYIYGTGGVNLEAGIGSDVQVARSTFGASYIKPYFSSLATPSNLIITGRSNVLSPNQYVSLTMVNNIDFENSATITNVKSITYNGSNRILNFNSNGAISNLGTINGTAYSPGSAWSLFPALGNVDLSNFALCNVSNINGNIIGLNGATQVNTVAPAITSYAGIFQGAFSNTNLISGQSVSIFANTAVHSVGAGVIWLEAPNGVQINNELFVDFISPYWDGVGIPPNININGGNNGASVEIQDVKFITMSNGGNINMCNGFISNVSQINGVNYDFVSNWANYPAVSNVSMTSNNLIYSNYGLRQGVGTFGSGSVQTLEAYKLADSNAGAFRSASLVLTKVVAGSPVYADDVSLFAFNFSNPARLQTQSAYGTETIAYLTDIDFRPSNDIYVAINGNDTTGDGSIINPFLTVARALTLRATISTAQEVSILLSSGTFTENISIPQNTYIVGVGSSEVREPTNIAGVITFSGANAGINDVTLDGSVVVNNGAGSVAVMNNINLTSGSGVVAITSTTGNLFVTECRINSGAGDAIGISTAAGILTMRDTVVTHAGVANAVVIGGTSSSSLIRQCYIASSTTSATPASIIRYTTSATHSTEINFTRIAYGSGTTDTGGNKCCIQFANTATLTAQIAECLLQCFGASTGGTRIECIQKTGAGSVTLTYGDLQTIAPASFINSGITKSPMTLLEQGVFGCFSSSVTTQVTGANVPTLINHNVVEVNSGVLSISGGNINLNRAGNYEVSTSIQFYKTGGGTDLVYFWLRLNGVDVLRSASSIRLANNNGEVLGNVTAMISANAGDALSVVFGSADATVYAQATGAQTTPMVVPAIPSCITNVKLLN